MTLDQVKKGETVQIASIPNKTVLAQAIRFGIGEGSEVVCAEKLPAGPIVLQKNRQEIAVGRALAKEITVKPVA